MYDHPAGPPNLGEHMNRLPVAAVVVIVLSSLSTTAHAAGLKEVAQSKTQWTGVAASKDGRVFVNFPRWTQNIPMSVGEIKNGTATAFPDPSWNSWKDGDAPDKKFVCVQSVVVDGKNRCWVLDPASPNMKGIVPGGPKLVQIDLVTNKVVRVYPFDERVAPQKSYLNDVRFDLKANAAYITESGTGALIVLDLSTGKARRLLSDHPSTKAENISIVINGTKLLRNGSAPKINADSIALDPQGKYLWYKALTAKTLYRIPVTALLDPKLSASQVASKVENMGQTVPTDGIEFGADGNLYLTSIEDNSIKRYKAAKPRPQLETIVKDPRLDWPDSFAVTKDGGMLVTTSQIDKANKPSQPYGLFEFSP